MENTIELNVTNNRALAPFIIATSLVSVAIPALYLIFSEPKTSNQVGGILIFWLAIVIIFVLFMARKVLRPKCRFEFFPSCFNQVFLRSGKIIQHNYAEIRSFEEFEITVKLQQTTYFLIRFNTKKPNIVITKDPLSEAGKQAYLDFLSMFRSFYDAFQKVKETNQSEE